MTTRGWNESPRITRNILAYCLQLGRYWINDFKIVKVGEMSV